MPTAATPSTAVVHGVRKRTEPTALPIKITGQLVPLAGSSSAAPLANLINLKRLMLTGTPVKDAEPLASLTNLGSLWLWDTQVTSVAPIANLTDLRFLDLEGTQVADAIPLANLTNLQFLHLEGTRVSNEQVAELKRAFAQRGNTSVTIYGPSTRSKAPVRTSAGRRWWWGRGGR